MIAVPDGIELVLASGSPRRRELLAQAGLEFVVRPADIDERTRPDEAPGDYVRRLSIEKAIAVATHDEIVIAADTTVAVDGHLLEKPADDDDARRMLRLLSGRAHECHTGVTVVASGCASDSVETIVVTTEVVFVELSDATIDWYVATGEAHDKAGAYGVQGSAGAFVERLDGSVTNVIGLPLAQTLAMIRSAIGA